MTAELTAMLSSLIPYAVTVIVFIVVLKLLSIPFKVILKLIINSIIGGIAIFAVNFFGAAFGFHIAINFLTCVIVGILGLPGVIIIYIYQTFFAE